MHSEADAAQLNSRYLYVQQLQAGDTIPVAAIRTEAFDRRFAPYNADSMHCLRCVYWAKFYVKNELKYPGFLRNWILEFNDASYIDVFVFSQNGLLLSHARAGTLVPASEQAVEAGFRINRVKFTLIDTAVATVYIRYERTTGHRPGFDKLRLIPKDYDQMPGYPAKRLSDGIFMGFLLTAFLFNLLFFIATQDRVFLYQSFFLIGVLVFMFETMGLTYDAPFFRDHPQYIMPVSYSAVVLINLAYIQFIRLYMGLKTLFPAWDNNIRYLIAANLLAWVAVLLFYFQTGNEFACDRGFIGFLVVQYLILSYLVYLLHQTKEKTAYFLTGAMLLVILGVIANGISIFQGRSIQVGLSKWILAGNIVLFFLGLAYRMKKLEKEEQEALRIKDMSELRTRLFTNITHEFRTPLTLIQGMAEQVGHYPKVAGEGAIQKAVAIIQSNGERLLALVNRMLDLAKLESGRMELVLHRSDVVAQLRYLVESFGAYAAAQKIHLQFLTDLPAFEMDYDQEKLQQVVSNLLSNALKFTPEGGRVFVSVKHEATRENGALLMEFRDTGEGIPADELPHIFNRFYQAKNSEKKAQGTGIGLALTLELVKLMGGTIAVESTVGRGAVFTVRLPVARDPSTPPKELTAFSGRPAAVSKSIPRENTLARQSSTGAFFDKKDDQKPLLLIIEDHADVIYYLRILLEAQYEIETASNGVDGIECALETIPDIIISDVMMPGKDGLEVCATLKNDHRTSHIPIILLTAKAAFNDRIAGLKRGADAYLTKPFREEELLVCLENILQTRKRLLERYEQTHLPAVSEDDGGVPMEDAFIRKLQAEVEKNMQDEHFGIFHLCRAMQMSRTQLHRKISALTGKSTSHYIRSIRLLRAKALLLTTQSSVAEIAYAVGFSDPNYFTRTFTEAFGSTPGSSRSK